VTASASGAATTAALQRQMTIAPRPRRKLFSLEGAQPVKAAMGRRFATIESKWPIFRDTELGTSVAPALSISDSLPATGRQCP
jgi:hypothetical protein